MSKTIVIILLDSVVLSILFVPIFLPIYVMKSNDFCKNLDSTQNGILASLGICGLIYGIYCFLLNIIVFEYTFVFVKFEGIFSSSDDNACVLEPSLIDVGSIVITDYRKLSIKICPEKWMSIIPILFLIMFHIAHICVYSLIFSQTQRTCEVKEQIRNGTRTITQTCIGSDLLLALIILNGIAFIPILPLLFRLIAGITCVILSNFFLLVYSIFRKFFRLIVKCFYLCYKKQYSQTQLQTPIQIIYHK